MRYLLASGLAALLILGMFLLAAGVRGMSVPADAATEPQASGGQLLLVSLGRTIDRFGLVIAGGILLLCLVTAALCRPGGGRSRPPAASKHSEEAR